jgi:hypothetical protein
MADTFQPIGHNPISKQLASSVKRTLVGAWRGMSAGDGVEVPMAPTGIIRSKYQAIKGLVSISTM